MERNINVERYTDWLPFPCPQLETWLATQACALTGNCLLYTSDAADDSTNV